MAVHSINTYEYLDRFPGALLIDEKTESKRRESISKSLEGLPITDSHRENLSTSHLGIVPSEETRQRMSFSRLSNPNKESIDNKISTSMHTVWSDLDYWSRESKRRLGTEHTEEWNNRISISNTGKEVSEETRQKLSEANSGNVPSDETRQRISKGLKAFYSSKEGELTLARRLQKRADSKPELAPYLSKGEKYIHIWLEEVFPGQWEYTGNGSFHIGSKNPDFKHTTKMKIIEFYGSDSEDYHGHILGEEEERSREFAEHGYEVLFIRSWEIDLKDRTFEKIAKLLNKVKKFSDSLKK
jgi:hypothetical protein